MTVYVKFVETLIVDIPTIRPHVLSMATMHSQTLVILRITGSDDVEGIGEGTTIGGLSYGAESPESIKSALDKYIIPVLKDQDISQVNQIMQRVQRYVSGNPIAKCALEMALLDAVGKRLVLPVSELIGGGRVTDRLPVAWTLASGDTTKDIAEAEYMIEQRRHRIFKLKIGKKPLKDDVSHVAAIKKALGEQASIRVDVNQAWDEATADRGMGLLSDAGVDLVEQPVARHATGAMTRLSARHTIPLMADEALSGPVSAFTLAAATGARIFALKIAQSGGLYAARDVASIAMAAGIGLYGGTMLEAGIGTIASAHVFATLPSLTWGTELFGPLLLTEEILETPLDYSDFSLSVPTGPGLGITLNEKTIARFRRQ